MVEDVANPVKSYPSLSLITLQNLFALSHHVEVQKSGSAWVIPLEFRSFGSPLKTLRDKFELSRSNEGQRLDH